MQYNGPQESYTTLSHFVEHGRAPHYPENKRFWMDVSDVARELINPYVTLEMIT